MVATLTPPRIDRPRLTSTNHKQVHKKERDRAIKESSVARVLRLKKQDLLVIGAFVSVWAIFAPMVNIQTSGTVKPFDPYDFQIELIQTIEENQNTVICKSRQMGISETICCYLLMRALTEPGFSAVVFSKTQADSSELGRRIRDMALSLGNLCPQLTSESATKLAFKGLGRIHFLPVTARAARGIPSVSVVLFDEAAFIDGIDGVYQAAMPTLSMLGDRGKVIFNSTPNGKTGLFYRLLTAGVGELARVREALDSVRVPANNIAPFARGKNPNTRAWEHRKWSKVFLHWRAHPVYGADPNWAEKTRTERQLTEAQWNQEYELDFAEGQRNVFSQDLVDLAGVGEFKDPQFARSYLVGVDPSFGGEDFYTVRVWDVTQVPYELVAEFKDHYKSKDFYIEKTVDLLDLFEPALIVVETNGGGALYQQELIKLRPHWKVEGVNINNTAKLLHTDRLVLQLERGQMLAPAEAMEEYKHFVESINGTSRTREAESGWHDDTVTADATAFAKIDEVPPPQSYSSAVAGDRPIHNAIRDL